MKTRGVNPETGETRVTHRCRMVRPAGAKPDPHETPAQDEIREQRLTEPALPLPR
jgi:hypothetical protein